MKKAALIITCSAVCVYIAAEAISRIPVKARDIERENASYPDIPFEIIEEVQNAKED